MLNALIFGLGLFVTALVALAIWSIGQMDVDDGPAADAGLPESADRG